MQALIAIFASMKKLWILLGFALFCACQPEPHFFDGADNLYNLENGAVLTARKADAAGMTIGELTVLACLIGLTDALNLDGGGSSTLWTLPGGVLNHPCDNKRFDAYGQRRVPNVLALKKGN